MALKDPYGDAAERFLAGTRRAVLTGAGISVDCGIPDFRGPSGLWSRFDPDEYATLEAFVSDPERAWRFYRSLGEVLLDRYPGPAHRALAEMELGGYIDGVVTQNIDGLHSAAGSRRVVEIHGSFRYLRCWACRELEAIDRQALFGEEVPRCCRCGEILKPDVVLFGEPVRDLAEAEELLGRCDVLLLIGTSGSVFPVAGLPFEVSSRGGVLIEFNTGRTPLSPYCEFHLAGRAEVTVPAFLKALSRQATVDFSRGSPDGRDERIAPTD